MASVRTLSGPSARTSGRTTSWMNAAIFGSDSRRSPWGLG